MQQPKLNIVLDYLMNIYEISEKIYNITIRYNDTDKNNGYNIKSLYAERAKFVNKLCELKSTPGYEELFLQYKLILGKEYKKIADIESITMSYLENKTKELAQELIKVKNKKALLVYKKV